MSNKSTPAAGGAATSAQSGKQETPEQVAAREADERAAAEKVTAEAEATRKRDAESAAAAASPKAVQLVKLHRVDTKEGEPSTADVHPDEVTNYTSYGWRLTE